MTGGNLNHRKSKKVRGRMVGVVELVVSGGGATEQSSRTLKPRGCSMRQIDEDLDWPSWLHGYELM